MASFLQQLRLLLWKNGLSVTRQPAWSLALLVWPLVIFIILAITRSQFPPKLTDTCYVAPRNLPSAGFFPFLQTLMCNTDSICTNKSYLTEGQSKMHWYTGHRQRRDFLFFNCYLSFFLDSSFQNIPNVTSVMHTFNNTALVDQVMWESVNVLKKSLCSFSMTAINTSANSQDLFTKCLINFCSSNDTVLEASLLTLNQVLTEMLLSNPTEALGSIGGTVVVLDMLQQETSVWDFLLGLPDLFLKPTDEEILNVGVLLAWSQTSASADLAFTKEVFGSFLGLVSPSSLDAFLKHSRSQRSSDAQPQSLGEQLYVNPGYFASLVGVVNGTVMYNVTPSILMAEWHSLYTTSLQYVTALQKLQTELNEDYFAAWIPGNISVGLSQILLTRVTGILENMGSPLENSSLWPSMEPYFHMAYWILTYQPNATASPNCEYKIIVNLSKIRRLWFLTTDYCCSFYKNEKSCYMTHDLIRDLEICSALGQDCVADIQNVFDNLGAMLAFGNNITMPTTPLWGNMTLPVALDVLALLLPRNMSWPAEASMEISRKIQYLLEQAYASPIFNISQSLQASNLTISELEQVNTVIHSNWSASILQALNMAIQIPQCVNTQTTQSPQKPLANGQAKCVLQLIQTASGLLGVIPVAKNAQMTLNDWLNITAVEYQKLNNKSISGSGPLAMTEEVLITTLSAIRQNLQGLDVENITDITNELNILEDLLKNVFKEQYPYHTINSTLMVQGQYAQKVYGEITLWYLNKLGNDTSGSVFLEILHQLKRMTEMQVALINAKADMVTLTMNQIQNLTHVRLPLEGEDLVQVASTIMTMLQGELALIKGNLEIQQAYYDSLGSPVNISIPAQIEGQIMTYLSMTREWITNPQVMTALARIFQWEISSVDITTPGKDLEQLLQAMAPLLSPEYRVFIAVAEQVSQAVNYTLQLASTDGGLRSENFTEAVINTVRVVLKSISNETGTLPQDVVNNILGAFNSSLQLIINSNMSYAQRLYICCVLFFLSVLLLLSNYILYIYCMYFVGEMKILQNSLPSNNTAQPIISMIIKVTENLLSSNEGNLTRDWIINQQLTIALDRIFQGNVSSVDLAGAGVNLDQLLQAMAPLLSPEDRAFLAVAEQILSGSADQLTFDKLEDMLAALFSTFEATPMWDSLPTVVFSCVSVNVTILSPVSSPPCCSCNLSVRHYLQQIWQDVRAGSGSEDTVALWCNISLLPVIAAFDKPAPAFNMTVSLSSVQMALDQITREAPWMTPYIEAAGKTIEVILQNGILLQNSTASPQIIMQALEITLTGMNFTKETINYILSGDIFMNPNRSTVDSLIKEVIQQIIGTGLLRDWPTLYGIMQQVLYLEDTSGTLWKTVEFFNWLYTTQDTGLNFVLEILRKLYEIVRDALTKMPLPCFSETFIDLFGNVLYMLKQIKLTSDLFDPVEQYLSPLKMQIAQGQDLQGLVSYTRNARRIASEVQREPVDDFLDLLDIDYQALLEVLSIPPTSTEIMETIHVFFANPDLGVILKGYLKEMTGGTSQEETIDTALNVLSFLTLPSNGLPVLLTNLANSLPEDLQYSSLIKTIMRSLANESQGVLFPQSYAPTVAYSAYKYFALSHVCALENMASVQLITSFLPLGPRLLCDTVVPTIQAFHVLTNNLVNQSTDIYDLIFQTFVGDPSTYNTEVDWTSTLSEIVGFDVSTLKTLNINITSPGTVKSCREHFYYNVFCLSSLPSSQILAWLANLHQCSDPSSLQLDPTGQEIFSTFCELSHEWYSITVIFLRHVDMKLVLSKEIQDLVGIMLEMVKFLTDIMHKLVPAINKLQEYLTNIGELNLVANQEFHGRSTMSSRATFSTIARALCKNGILTLFAIAKVPIVTETDPSVQTDHKREELIKKFKIPHDASPFCMNLYLDMVNTTGGAVAWAFLKPMLLGQVLYSPDTPVTREIMRKSNSTLHQFGDLKLYASEWIESSSYVLQSADILTKTLPILQNSLRNPFVQNFIQTQTGIDVAQMSSTLSQFSNMTVLLEKNKFIMEQITTLSMLMMNLSSCVNFDRYRAFNSTDELDEQAERLAQNRELYASIIFKLPEETSSSLPLNIDYTIRMNIENVMRTDRARNPFWVKDAFMSSTKTQRYNRGFVYLQESIDRAIIEMQTGKAMDGPAVQMQAFPYPCYYKDEYLNSLAFAFPMALMTCWVLFVAHFVKKLVHERELRLHEYMKMMGVNPISHFFAWLIESAVFLLVTVIILTIILKAGGILPHSDGFVLFLYLSDYGFSVLAISFLVSSFFDKTNIAGLSGSLIYVICFFPFIVLIHLEDNLSFSVKSALSLFSPTCFSYASQYISRYEKQEEGIQWSNMYISPLAGDTSSFGWLCWLLLIDSVVYFIIGIYIRMVFPGKYGIGLPWYFPVTRSFWTDMFSCCSRTPKKIGRGLLFTNMMQEQNITDKSKGTLLHSNGEDDFSGLPVGVSLYGLTKTYDNRHAVDNLNLSFYEGHVTSLLGHNGAGKTTTMSLLTGLFAPTSGTIEVYGMDMQTSIDDVRKEMGVCMQYDVLFDHLTTKEHLLLYAQIKAPHLTKQEVNEQVRRILMETDMHSHRHKRVGTLSGGMKRKLSISIAFIGGSRLVVLDEPTTGVDPCSRRSIWDIVLQHKKERTIILSTHHLDEAEVLSDRIAFLERGGLKCCGSPFYLKDKLAQGYNLTLTKKVQTPDSNQKLNIEELRDFIQSYLPDAQQKEGEVGDLVYALPPYTPQNAAAYHSLLTGLDQNLDELQLGCYGISDTTLEEVFLQLTRDNMEPTESETWSVSESVTANDIFASRDSIPDDLNSTYFGEKASLTGTSTVRGLALTAQQVRAMLLKRVHHSRRDWKGLFSQVVLPVLFVIAAMGLGSIKSDLQHFPKIVLSPALYHIDEQYTFFRLDSLCSQIVKFFPILYHGVYSEFHSLFSHFQSCPASDYEPPHKRNPSSQIVYNLTGINIEDYLLATANDFIRNRYGGWDFGKSLPIDLKMDMLDVPANRTLSKVWYNPEGHHTMPAYLNSLNNFILRSSLPPEKRQQYTISISSHPYPGQVQDEDVMVGGLVSILVAICVLTGYSIMTASFVIYEVHEHHTGSKRLQQISGISEPFYWIINFFYDMTLYLIPVVLSVAMIAAFQLPAFTEKQNLGAVTLLLVLFGFSTFPWMYLLSAVFKDTEMAFIGYVCINLFISVNTIISTSILYFLGQLNQNDPSIQNVYHTMSNIFLVFPQFSFGNGLMELARVDMQVQILSAFGVDAYKNPFSLDVLGWMYISMFLQGFICFTLRLLLNKTLLRKVSPNEDEDVVAERLRVDRGDASADILQVKHLTKVYQNLNKRVQAVKRLSVGIPAGECFGLLGVNGAGKTTTFKMLTGDISPTDGSARIRDIDGRMVDIIDSMREGINIGYCPQVDALDDLLTGEEHLYFYARIKGISKRETDRVVNYLLKKLELNYHRHNTSESYSCGTRRKLSTALALIGNPQILLLDEPSSGMDPRSKRHLWKIISEQVMGKCAVVLTSHSMEECEALCTRLAIMVKGQFRCLGSLQHIKNRFGKGFTVKMYLAGASCDVDMISNFMQQNFPSTFLKDHHSNMVEYHVPVAPGGVASIFGLLESNKNVLQIKHFSVSQTTLDEVFINFAMGKTDTDEQEVTEGTDIDSLDSYNALDR
uniref:ATP-binding cassette, sub-family A (ABC1), member 12 n=1 Tax=Cyprinus carpio TaxID=7962 RepID=A0A8C1YCU5_CYPCA